jgi:hypothetical protein
LAFLHFFSFSQARIAADLKDLRNSSVFGFFMINALFVLIVFLLQLNKDNLHVKWPISARVNVTYDEVTQEVKLLGVSIICNQQTLTTFSCVQFQIFPGSCVNMANSVAM